MCGAAYPIWRGIIRSHAAWRNGAAAAPTLVMLALAAWVALPLVLLRVSMLLSCCCCRAALAAVGLSHTQPLAASSITPCLSQMLAASGAHVALCGRRQEEGEAAAAAIRATVVPTRPLHAAGTYFSGNFRHCPGRKPPFLVVKRPARPYKSAIENRFT
jgi:hypothetical protein